MPVIPIILLIILLDQITKYFVKATMSVGQSIPVIPDFFYITYVLNPGAAFGIFKYHTWIFIAVAGILLFFSIYFYPKISSKYISLKLSIPILVGGALGNVIDRINSGFVVDYFDFKIWPVFNIADCVIVASVAIIIYNILFIIKNEDEFSEKNKYFYNVEECENGIRIDLYLVDKMKNFSRSYIQKVIETNQVLVNDKIVKTNYRVQTNDNISVEIQEPNMTSIKSENIPITIIYKDKSIIVVNKQRGMVVHPAAGNYEGTLVNALLGRCEDLSGINGEIRPGIVHRLDKDTSGVMVVAKNDSSHINLANQIKNKIARRKYIAIVNGNITEEAGMINAPIGRHSTYRKKMAVTFNNSKEASTKFNVIERFGKYTLVKCELLTGRTHQIRVHMAYIKHPVLGDIVYGIKNCPFNIRGQALHAYELSFNHPDTNEEMVFNAPIPNDMNEIISFLRSGNNV